MLASYVAVLLCAVALIGAASAFGPGRVRRAATSAAGSLGRRAKQGPGALFGVPLELAGQLDPTKKWKVKFVYKGETKEVEVSEGSSALEVGETLWDDVESSCRNGVCTTCAGKVSDGRDSVKLAVHGLGKPQIDAGFVCTCQCYVCGPGVTIQLGMNDEVYESQYGQYEESYEMKFADASKKEGAKKNKLFGI